MSEHIQAVVIGAGAIGLAVARAIALEGYEAVLVEKEKSIATSTSARNSEVIHAGIYYPENSLKAKFCVRGKQQLYQFCKDHDVPFNNTGKLIVATSETEHTALESLFQKARLNGVNDLKWLDQDDIKALEPELNATKALLSPSSGIIDSHAYYLALLADFENKAGLLALDCAINSIERRDEKFFLTTTEAETSELSCDILVNAAGLEAISLAGQMRFLHCESLPNAYFCKGNYFSLAQKSPFSHLIYPVPEAAGLGVHLTLDLAGQARFGPDTEWLKEGAPFDYRVDPSRADVFYEAIRRYWPGLPDNSLQPDYSGIRPKLQAPGESAKDFVVSGPKDHGIVGLVNLFGIESPGLTSSLAIADHVVEKLGIK